MLDYHTEISIYVNWVSLSTKYDLYLIYQLSLKFKDGDLWDTSIWGKYIQREGGREQR